MLDAIIRGALDAPEGEWDAELAVAALRAIRADPARADALDAADSDQVIEAFLAVYRAQGHGR